ncbi:MAG: hypothetical protein JWM50_1578 [Microbacteriaceae bacterium]|nr:hypothetical protein [Microbacteriaceae bacterium]
MIRNVTGYITLAQLERSHYTTITVALGRLAASV